MVSKSDKAQRTLPLAIAWSNSRVLIPELRDLHEQMRRANEQLRELQRQRYEAIETVGIELLRRGYTLSECLLTNVNADLTVLSCRRRAVLTTRICWSEETSEKKTLVLRISGPSWWGLPHRPLWLREPVGEQ